MSKTMTKYQLDHFKSKVKRNFNPLIEEQELLVKQQLKQLEDLKTKAIDQVMESGTPEELIKQLDQTTKKIGIAWVVDTSKIKQIEA